MHRLGSVRDETNGVGQQEVGYVTALVVLLVSGVQNHLCAEGMTEVD